MAEASTGMPLKEKRARKRPKDTNMLEDGGVFNAELLGSNQEAKVRSDSRGFSLGTYR